MSLAWVITKMLSRLSGARPGSMAGTPKQQNKTGGFVGRRLLVFFAPNVVDVSVSIAYGRASLPTAIVALRARRKKDRRALPAAGLTVAFGVSVLWSLSLWPASVAQKARAF